MKLILNIFFIAFVFYSNIIQCMKRLDRVKKLGEKVLKRNSDRQIPTDITITRCDSEPVQCRPPGALLDIPKTKSKTDDYVESSYGRQNGLQNSTKKSKEINYNALDNSGRSPLCQMIRNREFQKALNVLKDRNLEIDVGLKEMDDNTALHEAVRHLKKLNDINKDDYTFSTNKILETLIKALLLRGADKNAKNQNGETPNSLAEEKRDSLFMEGCELSAQTNKELKKEYCSPKPKKLAPKKEQKIEIKSVKKNNLVKFVMGSAMVLSSVYVIYKFLNSKPQEKK